MLKSFQKICNEVSKSNLDNKSKQRIININKGYDCECQTFINMIESCITKNNKNNIIGSYDLNKMLIIDSKSKDLTSQCSPAFEICFDELQNKISDKKVTYGDPIGFGKLSSIIYELYNDEINLSPLYQDNKYKIV